MANYRTEGQWEEMLLNMINGNWSDAAQNAVDYGFYANDITKRILDNELEEWDFITATDFITLAEMAAERRA